MRRGGRLGRAARFGTVAAAVGVAVAPTADALAIRPRDDDVPKRQPVPVWTTDVPCNTAAVLAQSDGVGARCQLTYDGDSIYLLVVETTATAGAGTGGPHRAGDPTTAPSAGRRPWACPVRSR